MNIIGPSDEANIQVSIIIDGKGALDIFLILAHDCHLANINLQGYTNPGH
jgi:hypothetical protein